jgi:hypothetical protein
MGGSDAGGRAMADKDFGNGDKVEWKSHGQKVKGTVKDTITDETWRDATSNSAPHLSRVDTIGQAKGMLMERFKIDAAAAFGSLTRVSQESNTPVELISQRLLRAIIRWDDVPAPQQALTWLSCVN